MREPGGLQRADPRRLIGAWRFDRTLTDLATGRHGIATGTLSITEPDGLGLCWYEQGELSWAGTTVPVTRELRIVPTPSAGEWQVTFADGRPFHPWQPGAVVEHLCGDDEYRGRIDLRGEDEFRVEWTVSGPNKQHRYLTDCHRTRPDPEQPGGVRRSSG